MCACVLVCLCVCPSSLITALENTSRGLSDGNDTLFSPDMPPVVDTTAKMLRVVCNTCLYSKGSKFFKSCLQT